jgi:putative ABC transport system permease protein
VYAAMFPVSPRLRHATQPERAALENRMLAAFNAIPGVTATAVGSGIPYLYGGDIGSVTIPGHSMKSSRVRMVSISPRYFDALGIPVVRGRVFATGDRRNGFGLIVNQAFTERFSLGSDAVSHAVNVESAPGTFRSRTIIGVVGNIRNSLGASHVPTIYVPSDESAFPGMMVVRTGHPLPDLSNAIARAQLTIDPTSHGVSLLGMDAAMGRQIAAQRTIALFFGLLASVALILALAGTYAVTSSATQARTHEFGVRRAIGATAAALLREVIRGAGALGAIGIVAGVALMAMLSNQVDSILFQTSALDPLTIVSVGAGLLGATMLAALVPALRATRVDPAVTLHYE